MNVSALPPLPGPESLKSWAIRQFLNRLPSYRRGGGRVVFISADLTTARIRIRRTWRTFGQRGAIFGGSLYAAVDPCYVIMLAWRLGRGYAVWDKRAIIDFRKPARTTLYADIQVSEQELATIRAEANEIGRAERVFQIKLMDAAGEVHVAFDKTVVVKQRRRPHGR